MIVGSVIVAMCLFMLGWTSEIVNAVVKDVDKVFQLFGVLSGIGLV